MTAPNGRQWSCLKNQRNWTKAKELLKRWFSHSQTSKLRMNAETKTTKKWQPFQQKLNLVLLFMCIVESLFFECIFSSDPILYNEPLRRDFIHNREKNNNKNCFDGKLNCQMTKWNKSKSIVHIRLAVRFIVSIDG